MTLCTYGEVLSVISEAIGFFIIGSQLLFMCKIAAILVALVYIMVVKQKICDFYFLGLIAREWIILLSLNITLIKIIKGIHII